MADRFELAYIYAKVSGALAHSWIGTRALELFRLGRLPEIWRALFGDAPPALPEAALSAAAERRAVREALSSFRSLTDSLRRREPFFVALRRKSEFARIKRVLLALRDGETACPESDDPSLPPGFKAEAFPDVTAMFEGGSYAWISPESLKDLPAVENRLDRQFYGELWLAFMQLPSRRRKGLRELLLLEVELENLVWALRLSRYYSMNSETIKPLLIDLSGVDSLSFALDAASRNPEARSEWLGWKYESLLGPEREPWSLDVRIVEAGARRLLYRRLRHALHFYPFSYTPLYCFYKLLELETAVVLGVLEGVRLGAPAEELSWLALGSAGELR